MRQIFLFDSSKLSLMQAEDINQSPSLLITHYDPDINVLYLYAKVSGSIVSFVIKKSEKNKCVFIKKREKRRCICMRYKKTSRTFKR